ncbi:MAG: hypothetical protein ACRD1S_11360 [Vicinamibacterales bacterium]
MTTATGADTPSAAVRRIDPGLGAAAAVALVLVGVAATVDFPRAEHGFKGDEATYYMLGHSLVRDFDFTYERQDLIRVWEEYPAPEGVFLKRGKTNRFEAIDGFPWVRRVSTDEPSETRLYFGKSFIYPLVAAPFVWLFGTNGFLVLHALLIALDVLVAYLWLAGRGSRPGVAAAFAVVFLAGSVAPVYFVWITPELFNLSLVLYAAFLWRSGYEYSAAILAGIVTFSKPTHAVLIAPMVLTAAWRREWARAVGLGVVFGAVAGSLYLMNFAITGEFNYQGGYRKTFYSMTGFPFANAWETFDKIAPLHGRDKLLADTLANQHTLGVFARNIWYFLAGRHSGLIPYFFPGVVSLALFLIARREQRGWQWLVLGAVAAATAAILFITPFTWSGGGGPVGNRYFLSFYPLLLFLTPVLESARVPLLALGVGGLFTAKILLNPFWSSFNPGEHVKSGPLRLLPIELTMLNDLPVNANPNRSRRLLAGQVMSYFPDDNAYAPEGEFFWVRGKARADVILRAPLAELPEGGWRGWRIGRLAVQLDAPIPNVVSVDTGRDERTVTLEPGVPQTVTLEMPAGVPYRPYETPTSYVYVITITTSNGFVPFLEAPPSSDSRYLGARVTLQPEFR